MSNGHRATNGGFIIALLNSFRTKTVCLQRLFYSNPFLVWQVSCKTFRRLDLVLVKET